MLEVSSLRSPSTAADQRGFVIGGDHVGFPTSAGTDDCHDDFMVDDNLLDYIDFSSCCDVPFFDADGDILPDLEVDPTELLAEFSSPEMSPRADDGGAAEAKPPDDDDVKQEELTTTTKEQALAAVIVEEKSADGVSAVTTRKTKGDEAAARSSAVTTDQDSAGAASTGSETTTTKSSAGGHSNSKKKASAAAGNNSNGKRKVKVDWTPELHRRFVQAVEQLGIDKAVPSRILEIMGIECLTRHNIASHLQKYRSHRKHLMAREAEAATWAQKRHMYYAAAPAVTGAAAAPARTLQVDAASAASPWVVPTIGFPPPAMAQPPPPPPFCRPLHVWGHPPGAGAVEAAAPPHPMPLPVWPRHLAPPPRPLPAWGPAYWQQQYNVNAARKWGPHQGLTQGTPCVAPRFPVPGMVPHPIPMYRPTTMVPPPPPLTTTSSKLAELQLQLDAHPSKESIDAAIGDVLVKPWLPLPLGLKPPSLHSVMSELHKQGIPKVPPAATGSSTG